MKTYKKRIAFMVSYQTLVPYGGIGQFTKSFVELMTAHDVKVDIITDKIPDKNAFVDQLGTLANIISPKTSLAYSTHSAIFMYGDSFCYERMINFRQSLMTALANNIYDAIVCNTYESIQVAQSMGLSDVIQIIAYTHLESQIFEETSNPFLDEVNELMRKQLLVSGITIGTQSTFNTGQLKNALELPIPFTETTLFDKYHGPREGVLFIGRWEKGKNPELFLKLIEDTRLPARVMTNANGAKKFEERLKNLNVPYKICIGVTGEEKVNFIKQSRVAFNPSTVESYGIAFQETLTQLPTVGLKGSRWLSNFNDAYYFTTTKQDMAQDVLALYHDYFSAEKYYMLGALDYIKAENDKVATKWLACMDNFKPKVSASKTAKICESSEIKYTNYIKSLERTNICIDDIRSVLTNKNKFTVIYTDLDTYLSKDDMFIPSEEISLFDGL